MKKNKPKKKIELMDVVVVGIRTIEVQVEEPTEPKYDWGVTEEKLQNVWAGVCTTDENFSNYSLISSLFPSNTKTEDFVIPDVEVLLNEDKSVFVVLETYSTGDTFGNCRCAYDIRGVFTSAEKANSAIKTTLKPVDGYFERHIGFEVHPTTLIDFKVKQ